MRWRQIASFRWIRRYRVRRNGFGCMCKCGSGGFFATFFTTSIDEFAYSGYFKQVVTVFRADGTFFWGRILEKWCTYSNGRYYVMHDSLVNSCVEFQNSLKNDAMSFGDSKVVCLCILKRRGVPPREFWIQGLWRTLAKTALATEVSWNTEYYVCWWRDGILKRRFVRNALAALDTQWKLFEYEK